jgi:hypothetical protein
MAPQASAPCIDVVFEYPCGAARRPLATVYRQGSQAAPLNEERSTGPEGITGPSTVPDNLSK